MKLIQEDEELVMISNSVIGRDEMFRNWEKRKSVVHIFNYENKRECCTPRAVGVAPTVWSRDGILEEENLDLGIGISNRKGEGKKAFGQGFQWFFLLFLQEGVKEGSIS